MKTVRATAATALALTIQCIAGAPVMAGDKLVAKTVLDDANIELYTPVFIGNSSSIVVVRKTHEPDFHEAESFSEKELAESAARSKKEPRWADPEVTIISEDGKDKVVVDHGWSPAPTPNGSALFYVRQTQPISGKRVLAETQKGNSLWVYDFAKKERKEVIAPTTGYIGSPLASFKEDKIAYGLCDAVNGAWGGQVGAGIYDASKGTSETVLPPDKHFKLFDLLDGMLWNGRNLIVVRRIPQSEGTHVADEYKWEVLNISTAKPVVLYTSNTLLGMNSEFFPIVIPNDEKSIAILDKDATRIVDCVSGKVLKESLVKKREPVWNPSEKPSPDGRFTASLTKKGLEVRVKKTGHTMILKVGAANTYEWSPDSTKLAIVVTTQKDKELEVFDRDTLLVVSVPQD